MTNDSLQSQGIYFGWRVVAAVFLCVASLVGVALYGFIMFARPLSEQFGWTAAQTGSLVSAMWITGPMALFAGPLIARYGAWRLLILGMVFQVLALAALGLVTAFWQMYLIRAAMGLGKIAVMTSAPVVVARWFQRRFATAMAITWAGGAAGGMVMAPLTEVITAAYGWRAATLIFSAGLAVALALAGLLARGPKTPADLRLGKDGDPPPDRQAGGPALAAEDVSWRTVLASMNWLNSGLMCLSVYCVAVVAIALQSQQPAILERAGLSGQLSGAMLGLLAAAALIAAILAGWMLDRWPMLATSVSATVALFVGLGCVAVGGAHAALFAGLGAVAIGYGLGASEVVWITLFKRQFGIAAFATTYGLFYFSYQLGFASGGFIGGSALDHLGARGLLWACGLLFSVPALFSVLVPGMRRPAPD